MGDTSALKQLGFDFSVLTRRAINADFAFGIDDIGFASDERHVLTGKSEDVDFSRPLQVSGGRRAKLQYYLVARVGTHGSNIQRCDDQVRVCIHFTADKELVSIAWRHRVVSELVEFAERLTQLFDGFWGDGVATIAGHSRST